MSDDDFEAMKARFITVGDKLTDQHLLDLADCYHEMLRRRRLVRANHPSLAPAASLRIEAEQRTF